MPDDYYKSFTEAVAVFQHAQMCVICDNQLRTTGIDRPSPIPPGLFQPASDIYDAFLITNLQI